MPAAPAQNKPVVLNLSTEGRQIQIYDFVRESHCEKFNESQFTHCFIAEQSLLHKILEVLFIGIAREAYGADISP